MGDALEDKLPYGILPLISKGSGSDQLPISLHGYDNGYFCIVVISMAISPMEVYHPIDVPYGSFNQYHSLR